ncbi:TPA: hypothetical protein ACU16Q_001843 [Pasteurella multocida]|uniref:hypothetical protein n=1 Tax=Pasteurella multocida TaxID=747 RepID=UPI003981AA30
MTETENKYFSVDVSNDIHIVKLHETLEQAKKSCLDGATEAHEFADDMCDYEGFASNDLPYAVYGVVLGKAECKEKQLSEEEKEEYSLKVDDELARKQLGHSSSRTTQIYIRKDKPIKPIK